MRTPVTLQFLQESRAFALRYCCDDCVHFRDPVCTHGYPEGERVSRDLREGDEVVFCKEFDPEA